MSRLNHARVLTAIVVLSSLSLLLPPPAAAEPGGFGWQSPILVDAGASTAASLQLAPGAGGAVAAFWSPPPFTGGPLLSNYLAAQGALWNSFAPVNASNHTVYRWGAGQDDSCLHDHFAVYVAAVANNTSDVRVFFASRDYPSTTAWTRVEVGTAYLFGSARPYVFCRNDAVAVIWEQSTGINVDLMANHRIGGIWSGAFALDSEAEPVIEYTAAVDDAGTIGVAWVSYDGSMYRLYGEQYIPGTGWNGAKELTTPTALPPPHPAVAVGAGISTVIWHTMDGANHNLTSRQVSALGTWGPEELVATLGSSVNVGAPVADADSAGNVHVLTPVFSVGYATLSAVMRNATGWQSGRGIASVASGTIPSFSLAVDAAGNAFAAWATTLGAQKEARVARFTPSAGWANSEPFPSALSDLGNAANLVVAIDGTRRVTVAWVEPEGALQRVVVRQYRPDDSPPQLRVLWPYEGLVVNEPTVMFDGRTDAGVTVVVGGVTAAVSSYGEFRLAIALFPGVNEIVVVATERSGARAVVTVNVTYQSALADVSSALARAEANLSFAQGNLTALEARVLASELALTAALADQAALAALLAETDAAVTAASANVSAALDGLGRLEAEGNATDDALAQARANVSAAQSALDALSAEQGSLRSQLQQASANATIQAQELATVSGQAASAAATVNATQADLAAQRAAAERAEASAASASTLAMVALALGAAGAGAGLASLARSRRLPKGAAADAAKGDNAP